MAVSETPENESDNITVDPNQGQTLHEIEYKGYTFVSGLIWQRINSQSPDTSVKSKGDQLSSSVIRDRASVIKSPRPQAGYCSSDDLPPNKNRVYPMAGLLVQSVYREEMIDNWIGVFSLDEFDYWNNQNDDFYYVVSVRNRRVRAEADQIMTKEKARTWYEESMTEGGITWDRIFVPDEWTDTPNTEIYEKHAGLKTFLDEFACDDSGDIIRFPSLVVPYRTEFNARLMVPLIGAVGLIVLYMWVGFSIPFWGTGTDETTQQIDRSVLKDDEPEQPDTEPVDVDEPDTSPAPAGEQRQPDQPVRDTEPLSVTEADTVQGPWNQYPENSWVLNQCESISFSHPTRYRGWSLRSVGCKVFPSGSRRQRNNENSGYLIVEATYKLSSRQKKQNNYRVSDFIQKMDTERNKISVEGNQGSTIRIVNRYPYAGNQGSYPAVGRWGRWQFNDQLKDRGLQFQLKESSQKRESNGSNQPGLGTRRLQEAASNLTESPFGQLFFDKKSSANDVQSVDSERFLGRIPFTHYDLSIQSGVKPTGFTDILMYPGLRITGIKYTTGLGQSDDQNDLSWSYNGDLYILRQSPSEFREQMDNQPALPEAGRP